MNTELSRVLELAYYLALVHAGDRDYLGDHARELLDSDLVRERINELDAEEARTKAQAQVGAGI